MVFRNYQGRRDRLYGRLLKKAPATAPTIKPPKCACHATLGKNDRMTKLPAIATHNGIGAGMGKMYTFKLGLSTVKEPATAKTAPDAPTAMAFSGPNSTKNRLPTIPPMK